MTISGVMSLMMSSDALTFAVVKAVELMGFHAQH